MLDNAAIVHPSDETHSIVVIRSPDQPPYLSVVDGALQEVARLQFPTGVDEFELTAVAFAHNRKSLAVTDGSSVWLYKLLKGPPTRTMSREERWCRTLSFSPDDKFIVADGQGVFVMDTTRLDTVHELPDGRELWKLEIVEAESDDDESTTTRARAPTAGTRSRSSHADTRYRMKLSTVGEDLWEIHFDLTSLVRERRLSLLSPVTSTTTNATGNLLLVAESPTQCLVVDVDDFESLTYFRKPGMVRLSPDRDRIAWVGNVISFHDADSGARLAETLPKESVTRNLPLTGFVMDASWRLAYQAAGLSILQYDLERDNVRQIIPIPPGIFSDRQQITVLCLSPDSRRIAAASDNRLALIDITSGRVTGVAGPFPDRIVLVEFKADNPSRNHIAVQLADETLPTLRVKLPTP